MPAAVLKAAEAMRPHFDKCVDDFARRLSDFVNNAGNTLYRGISEILARTMLERKTRGGEVAELRAATQGQIDQVIAARAALIALRSALWASDAAPATPSEPIDELAARRTPEF